MAFTFFCYIRFCKTATFPIKLGVTKNKHFDYLTPVLSTAQ